METAPKLEWSFTVTVRKGFYEELLRALQAFKNYSHSPQEHTQSLSLYNAFLTTPINTIDRLCACKEPFDLTRANGTTHTLRFDEAGQTELQWWMEGEQPDQATMDLWPHQEGYRKRHLTKILLDG